jgi:hypothetical protein
VEVVQMNICPNCGTDCTEANFCPYCGKTQEATAHYVPMLVPVPGGELEHIVWERRSRGVLTMLTGERIATSIYRLTNRALYLHRSSLSTDVQQVPLNTIVDVGLEQTAAQRVLGVGNVIVHTNRQHIVLKNLEQPGWIQQSIYGSMKLLQNSSSDEEAPAHSGSQPFPMLPRFLDVKVLSTLLLFGFLLLKVFSTASFNPSTALGLVNASGPVSVLMGTIAALLPTLSVMALTYWVLVLPFTIRLVKIQTNSRLSASYAGLIVIFVTLLLAALAAVTSAFWLSALFLLLGLLGGRISYWRNPMRRQLKARANIPHYLLSSDESAIKLRRQTRSRYIAIVAGLGLLTAFASDLWLPPEAVSLKDGSTFTAYVLNDGGQWTTLLRENDRTILKEKPTDVIERSLCRIDQPRFLAFGRLQGPTLYQLLLGKEDQTDICPMEELSGYD